MFILYLLIGGIVLVGIVTIAVLRVPVEGYSPLEAGAPIEEFGAPPQPLKEPEAPRPPPKITSTLDGTAPVPVAPIAGSTAATPTGPVIQTGLPKTQMPQPDPVMPQTTSLPDDGASKLRPPAVAIKSTVDNRGGQTKEEIAMSSGGRVRSDGKCVAGANSWLIGEGILLREPVKGELMGWNEGSMANTYAQAELVGALMPAQTGEIQAVGDDITARKVYGDGSSPFRLEGVESTAAPLPSDKMKKVAQQQPIDATNVKF